MVNLLLFSCKSLKMLNINSTFTKQAKYLWEDYLSDIKNQNYHVFPKNNLFKLKIFFLFSLSMMQIYILCSSNIFIKNALRKSENEILTSKKYVSQIPLFSAQSVIYCFVEWAKISNIRYKSVNGMYIL